MGLVVLRGIVLDDEVLDLGQLIGDALVVVLVLIVEAFVLVLYMRAYLVHELVVAPQYQSRYLRCRIGRDDRFDEGSAQSRQAEVEEVRVRVLQVSLQRRQVDIFGECALVEDLIVDDGEERRRMDVMRLAYLLYRLLSYSHLQSETADDLDRIFLMRHQVAYLIG